VGEGRDPLRALSVRGIELSGVEFSLRERPRRVSARQPTYFLTSESRQRPPPIRQSCPAAPDRTALRCSRLGDSPTTRDLEGSLKQVGSTAAARRQPQAAALLDASNGGFKSAGSLRIVLEGAHIACGDVQPRWGARWVSCESRSSRRKPDRAGWRCSSSISATAPVFPGQQWANAGIHCGRRTPSCDPAVPALIWFSWQAPAAQWTPAFAGVTMIWVSSSIWSARADRVACAAVGAARTVHRPRRRAPDVPPACTGMTVLSCEVRSMMRGSTA